MKYLHLINDEKFTDFIISLFEECNPGNNFFLIGVSNISREKGIEPKYTKTRRGNIVFFKSASSEYFEFINKADFDVLFVHFLDYNKRIAILKLEKDPIIVWHAWGIDIYKSGFYKGELYQPETKKLLESLKGGVVQRIKLKAKGLYYRLSFRTPSSIAFKKAVSKINYCATVIPDEINILKEMSFFNATPVLFSNISIEYDFKDNNLNNDFVNGNAIIIGNSRDPTANHLDSFKKLHSLGITDRKIITPLTYGHQLKYADAIVSYGKRLFGDNFKPLLDFIPRREYINILKEGNVAIMNHDRQQGVGNLIALLWMGCKVFLSEGAVTFSYLRRKGFFVYSFQNEMNKESINEPLTIEQIRQNRKLIYEEHGHSNVLKKAKDLINIVSKDNLNTRHL